jgi:hypothetical protein
LMTSAVMTDIRLSRPVERQPKCNLTGAPDPG